MATRVSMSCARIRSPSPSLLVAVVVAAVAAAPFLSRRESFGIHCGVTIGSTFDRIDAGRSAPESHRVHDAMNCAWRAMTVSFILHFRMRGSGKEQCAACDSAILAAHIFIASGLRYCA